MDCAQMTYNISYYRESNHLMSVDKKNKVSKQHLEIDILYNLLSFS